MSHDVGQQQWNNNIINGHGRALFGNVQGDLVENNYYQQARKAEDLLLESLQFDGMESYRSRHSVSSPQTYRWLFDVEQAIPSCELCNYTRHNILSTSVEYFGRYVDCFEERLRHQYARDTAAHSFQTWLRDSGDKMFWFQGKAGSGKSCLMNHLSSSPSTANLLGQWGTDQEVYTLVHFFWISGSHDLERSRRGMLRHLLYQVLYMRQDLIYECIPQHLAFFSGSSRPKKIWTSSELHHALTAILRKATYSAKYCLFVDGLDECVPNKEDGDHLDLIKDLEHLSSPNVKICVSSRAWNVFENAFREIGQVSLHEINRFDIMKLVRSRLVEGHLASGTRHQVLDIDLLAANVVTKAEGVFQWAALVVDVLRGSMVDGSSMEEIEEILEHTPPELDDLYMQMLNRIKTWHQKNAARTFLLLLRDSGRHGVRDPAGSMPVILCAYISDDISRPELAWEAANEVYTEERYQDLMSDAQRTVKGWCGDLVDIVGQIRRADRLNCFEGRCVQWPHRTVFDFMIGADVSSMITNWAGAEFIPELTFFRIYLRDATRIPIVDRFEFKSDMKMFHGSIGRILPALSQLYQKERLLQEQLPPLLERVDSFGKLLHDANSELDDEPHWTRSSAAWDLEYDYIRNLEPASIDKLSSKDFLASWLMSKGIVFWPPSLPIYTLETEDALYHCLEESLLWVWSCTSFSETSMPSRVTVTYLLNRGIDVNKPIQRRGGRHYSVWQRFLVLLHEYNERRDFADEREILDVVKAMLRAGAQPSAPLRRGDLYSFHSRDNEWIAGNELFNLQEHRGWFQHEDLERYAHSLFPKVRSMLEEAIAAHQEHPSDETSKTAACSGSRPS